MMDITTVLTIYSIVIGLWLPQAVTEVLTWTYWWQVKEYRKDRFLVFMKTRDGIEKLGIVSIVLKLLSLAMAFFFPLLPFLIFLLLDLSALVALLGRQMRRPVVTERVKKLYLTSTVVIVAAIFLFLFLGAYKALFIGEILLVLSPYIGIFWTRPIVERVKKEEIDKAHMVLKNIKPTVIGVTGSYGKTTTKEFIYQILASVYKTAKTEGSENTEFGIARKTQKNVTSGTKYFVVEMGAYKIGEIKKLAEIVNPEIGVLTGIEPQHIELFGGLENIKRAKFELMEALPNNGTAVFNLSNEHCRKLAKNARKFKTGLKVYGYQLITGKSKSEADMYSRIENTTTKGITFSVYEGNKKHKFMAPVYGEHFVENITGAILVGRLQKIPWNKIKKAVSGLEVPEKTMRVHYIKGKRIIIDDSHNSTPKGFAAALKYIDLYKGFRKIVVTPGIIELGRDSRSIHEEIAEMLAKSADKVFITNTKPYREMRSPFLTTKKVLVKRHDRLIKALESDFKSKCLILFEGRIPVSIITEMKNKI